MNRFAKISLQVGICLAVCFALPRGAAGTVDDAQSFALQAAEPYVKEGFQVREDYWGGDLGSGEKKAVRQQLFKGNEYWFWLGTEVERAKVSVHIYDSEGKLAEMPDSSRDSEIDRQLFHHCRSRRIARGTDALGIGLRIPLIITRVIVDLSGLQAYSSR